MSGHVSMMHDVLLTQLPPSLLRSALRSILAQGSTAKDILISHVRSRLKDSPTVLTPGETLFPTGSTSNPSKDLEEYLASTRCYFSCGLTREALPYLMHFILSIPLAGAKWDAGSELERALEGASHDVVQCLQGVKESASPDDELEVLLTGLLDSIYGCSTYCRQTQLAFPFARAQLQVVDAIHLLFPSALASNDALKGPVLHLDPKKTSFVVETINLGVLEVPRLFNGLWQMSSPAWGTASSEKVDSALLDLIQAGLVASDMADHYGDAELLYGSFRNRLPPLAARKVVAATKWCVFKPLEEAVSEELVLAAVRERARRLDGRADLLQFHWQGSTNKDYLEIIRILVKLTTTHSELVTAIGLCNFDSATTAEVCEFMLAATGSVGIVSNQVQYSLIDSRPIFGMAAVCEKYGVKLLTYGSFCGGFLSDQWLNVPSPDVYASATPLTPSQRKYFDVISAWGSWAEFQTLLHTLRAVADVHSVDISNVGTRWVLQRPEVAAVIVGSRLGLSSHAEANCRVFTFVLSEEEVARIEGAALGDNRARKLFEASGDCGAEYR